jgi:hypothetical protein
VIDKFVMLEFLADREDAQPGVYPSGGTLFADAGHLEEQQPLRNNSVTRALADLRRLGWIDWVFRPTPRYQEEPRAQLLTEENIQQVGDIAVSDAGYRALADRRAKVGTQLNFINSTIGQVVHGDVNNIDLTAILIAAERELDHLDAPAEEKSRVRQALHQIAEVGKATATGVTSELLATTLRRALGLG